MQKAQKHVGCCFIQAIWAALFLLVGVRLARAQGTPDIRWITNGPDAHFDVVRSVAFSVDCSMLASGSSDGQAKVWTVPDGEFVQVVVGGDEKVTAVALSPDGSLLIAGSDEGSVRMWDVGTGQRLCGGTPQNTIVWSITISSDGSILAVGKSSPEVIVANASCSPGGFLLEGHESDVNSVAFSHDGSKLASASSDGTARIWQVIGGAALHVLTGHSFFNPTNEEDVIIHTVWSVDFSPDGAVLATSGADNTIRLWRVSDGTQVGVIDSAGVSLAKFSADGTLLLTLNGGAIHFYRVVDGQLLTTYPNARATCLDVASNGRYFAYGTLDGSVAVAYLPIVIQSMTQAGGKITLQWQGGSGLYRVQARPHLDKGDWNYLGPPTTNTTFTHAAHSHLFYRVQSLPNP